MKALYDDPISSGLFTLQEKAALRFAEQVTKEGEPSIECFAEAKQQFAPDQMVELTLLVGFWNLWNRLTETFKVDYEHDRESLVVGAVQAIGRSLPDRRDAGTRDREQG